MVDDRGEEIPGEGEKEEEEADDDDDDPPRNIQPPPAAAAAVSNEEQQQECTTTMDDRLKSRLESLTVPLEELPMDMGNFYQCYILSSSSSSSEEEEEEECNVRKSSYGQVRKWLEAMQLDGLVLLKKNRSNGKRYRRNASTKVVVAVGRDQVLRMRRGKRPPPSDDDDERHHQRQPRNAQVEVEEEEHEEGETITTSSNAQSHQFHHQDDGFQMRKTVHARDRQKRRNIQDRDIQAALESKSRKTPVQRKRDGIRIVTGDDGTTVVKSGGQKNTIVTAWKDDDPEGHEYVGRWSVDADADDTASERIDGTCQQQQQQQQSVVTVSETFQRYRQAGRRIGKHGRTIKSKWREGDLVRKNSKYRKEFLVVGLRPEFIPSVVKHIQNQSGCRCSVGSLSYDQWIELHGDIDAQAEEGSKTLSFRISEESSAISRVPTQEG